MGMVYRAQQHLGEATRPVAVKLIHPTLLLSTRDREEALTRFQAELRILVTLQHTHIARIYEGGIYEEPHTHERIPYLAMELVHGGLPLTTYATDCALAWPERLAVFGDICRAVQYAHEHRIVHRDLKPANLLVNHEGHVFVIDFGLAQICDGLLPGAPLAASGTPAYMSPEQVDDAFGAVSEKTDVYALGLILYELLTGQHPYPLPRDGSWAQLRQAITEAAPPPLRQYDEAYGEELNTIVTTALAKRPADRPSVAMLRSRLEHYRAHYAPERPPPAPRVGTWRAWIKTHPVWSSLIAVGLLVVAVALAWKGQFLSGGLGRLVSTLTPDVTGYWTTEVLTDPVQAKDEFIRSFVFEMKGDLVLGSTRIKSVHRKYAFYAYDIEQGILGGTLRGHVLSFYTSERRTIEQWEPGSPPQFVPQRKTYDIDYKTLYYGGVRKDSIVFTVHTDEPNGPPPKKFVVKRVLLPSPAVPGAASPAAGTQMGGGCPSPAPPATAEASTWRNSIGMEFRLIPAGEFLMGSEKAPETFLVLGGQRIPFSKLYMGLDKGRRAAPFEQPVHKACLSKPFYLGTYEVTQAQWREVMGHNPSHFTGDPNRPVESVSWDEVQEFIRRLNATEHHTHYRLPTEAEWEYAARAGTTTRYSFGDDPGPLGEYAWCNDKERQTHRVGQKRPNAWGLHDMLGNVAEWVQDWLGDYASEAVTDPQGPEEGRVKVSRGGSYDDNEDSCRSASRIAAYPDDKDHDVGFRLLRTAE
jgi:formylglycine-generating enzyme required for sulfatase activity